jgi:hypothetical protein
MDTTRETISDENGSGEDVNEKDGKDGWYVWESQPRRLFPSFPPPPPPPLRWRVRVATDEYMHDLVVGYWAIFLQSCLWGTQPNKSWQW